MNATNSWNRTIPCGIIHFKKIIRFRKLFETTAHNMVRFTAILCSSIDLSINFPSWDYFTSKIYICFCLTHASLTFILTPFLTPIWMSHPYSMQPLQLPQAGLPRLQASSVLFHSDAAGTECEGQLPCAAMCAHTPSNTHTHTQNYIPPVNQTKKTVMQCWTGWETAT